MEREVFYTLHEIFQAKLILTLLYMFIQTPSKSSFYLETYHILFYVCLNKKSLGNFRYFFVLFCIIMRFCLSVYNCARKKITTE